MHESPVARELVEAAAQQAAAAGDVRVTRMLIQLGPVGGYVADSLRMHVLAAAAGTAVEGAQVNIRSTIQGGPELVSIDVEEVD